VSVNHVACTTPIMLVLVDHLLKQGVDRVVLSDTAGAPARSTNASFFVTFAATGVAGVVLMVGLVTIMIWEFFRLQR
jgi:hypothetical protein